MFKFILIAWATLLLSACAGTQNPSSDEKSVTSKTECFAKIPTGIKPDPWAGSKWTGSCQDGKAHGYGVLEVNGSKSQGSKYTELKGTMVNGYFNGRVDYRIANTKGSSFSKIESFTNKDQSNFDKKTISDCAKELDAECVTARIAKGDDINETASNGVTPIFIAINEVRNLKWQTMDGYKTISRLILNGADMDLRINPIPLANDKLLTPKEFMVGSFHKGMFSLSPPDAPLIVALFSDEKTLKTNKKSKLAIKRAIELGLSTEEFWNQANSEKISQLRNEKTFDGYARAFELIRSKNDFNAAQELVKTAENKKRMEYLAVLATDDKNRLFDVSVKMNGKSSKKSDDGFNKNFLFVFDVASKSSNIDFVGSTAVKYNAKSPLKLNYPYRLTVKYTLTVSTIEQQGLTKSDDEGFLGGMMRAMSSRTSEDRKTFTEKIKYDMKAAKTASKNINFGRVEIASDRRGAGGIIQMKKTLNGDPTLTAEIIRIEPL